MEISAEEVTLNLYIHDAPKFICKAMESASEEQRREIIIGIMEGYCLLCGKARDHLINTCEHGPVVIGEKE